jgi:2-polyprenyl-6-methoxyphenol hydroxylase-like FAD-dependent oxidoreductase
MHKSMSVLVVGGGVAGLTAAALLARGGLQCDLVETARDPVGAAIVISGRALDALFDLAGQEDLLAAGTPNPLGHNDIYKSLGIFRPTLSCLLMKAAAFAGASIRVGTTLLDLIETKTECRASFSDGKTGIYDIVVGADGLRSRVREIVFPEAPRPTYSGQSCIRWMTPGEPIPGLAGVKHLPFGILLTYPVPGQTYAATVFTFRRRNFVTQEAAKALLDGQLAEQEPIATLRARLNDTIPLLFRPFEWLLLPRPWSRGRVVLVGDAAHATTPHMAYGGGMAIEDSVVLAQAILAHDVPGEAFKAFEERRFERVRHVVETSVTLSRMQQAGEPPFMLQKTLRPALEYLNAAY